MKNNCQGFQKYGKVKSKIAPRKKKYSLKQRLWKVNSHIPLIDNIQNGFIQQQTTNQFFQLLHKNFKITLTQNSQIDQNKQNNTEQLLPSSRTNKNTKKTQNSQNKKTSRNSYKNKNSIRTKSRQKKRSESVRKNNKTGKTQKVTLKKDSKSCKTVIRKKKQLNNFISIIPSIRI